MTAGKKKRKSKKLTPITKLICICLLAVSAYMIYMGSQEIIRTITLSSQISEAKQRLQEVEDQNTALINEREKLQDPDYVQNYARDQYMLTKEGEQIFYLPDSDK